MNKREKEFEAKKRMLRANGVKFEIDSEKYSRQRERYIQKLYTEFTNNRREEIIRNVHDSILKEEGNQENVAV